MTEYCILCKKKKNRNTSPYRSFHLFPKNAARRDQWTKALNGVVPANVGKHTNVCSDHFNQKWFNPITKLLASGAIPDPALNHLSTTTVSYRKKNLDNPINNSSDKRNETTSIPVRNADGKLTIVEVPTIYCTKNLGIISDTGLKSTSSIDNTDIIQEPRSRKLNSLQRSDFTSAEAWHIYRLNHFATKRKEDVLKKRIARNDKITRELKLMVKSLQLKSKKGVERYFGGRKVEIKFVNSDFNS